MRRQHNCVSCRVPLRLVVSAVCALYTGRVALAAHPPSRWSCNPECIDCAQCVRFVCMGVHDVWGGSGRRPLRLSCHGPRPLRPWIPPMQFILSFLQHLSRERKTSAVAQSRRTTGAPRRDSGRRECDARRGLGTTHETGGGRGTRPPPRESEREVPIRDGTCAARAPNGLIYPW